jgi:hypothetical protein
MSGTFASAANHKAAVMSGALPIIIIIMVQRILLYVRSSGRSAASFRIATEDCRYKNPAIRYSMAPTVKKVFKAQLLFCDAV